ncbi:glycoside hydrolase family 28 protein [Powellomyces hirtus]|nr:glycoside hydrolase family 28 protein [Powellomyces hirtus]
MRITIFLLALVAAATTTTTATPLKRPPKLPKLSPVFPARICKLPRHAPEADIGPLITHLYKTCIQSAPGSTLLIPPGTHKLKTPVVFRNPPPFIFKLNGKIDIPFNPALRGTLITFEKCSRVRITGQGSIHGNGEKYRPNGDLLKYPGRPRLLRLQDCHHSSIQNIRLVNSPKFHIVVIGNNNVVKNVVITADRIGETDGINFSGNNNSARDITVTGGDECVTVKSPTKNFRAENIVCKGTAGTNIGSFGRNGVASIDGVYYKNVKIIGGKAGVLLKAYPSTKGIIKNVKYENFQIHDTAYPIDIDMHWCHPGPCGPASGNLKVRNIMFKNFVVSGLPSPAAATVKSRRPLVNVHCLPGRSCSDVQICNLDRKGAKHYAPDFISKGSRLTTRC